MTEDAVTRLARTLGRSCLRRKVSVCVAESCTGGGVAEAITRIPGSSRWFDRGFVTYTDEAKRAMLGVSRRALKAHGAVSEAVARAMALGVLKRSSADVSVAVTGIAGPAGGSPAKPVGLVWLAWAARGDLVQARAFRLRGGRAQVRRQSVCVAIQGLIDLLR